MVAAAHLCLIECPLALRHCGTMAVVKRVVVVGRGAAGKSVFARALSCAAGLPYVELDKVFWSADLRPTSAQAWREMQDELVRADTWVLDGDLGPYDSSEVRLRRADTIVLFDLSATVCAWRAFRRSHERLDFWRWLLTWRRRHRAEMLDAIRTYAPRADLHVVRKRGDRDRILTKLIRQADGT